MIKSFLYFLCGAFFLCSQEALSASCSDQSPSCLRVKTNDGVVKVIAGSRTGTYTQMTSEMANVLPKYSLDGQMRVVPILGINSWQNIQDLLYLKGIDIALVQNDVLSIFGDEEPTVTSRVRYIAGLYKEEIHVIARKNNSSIEELRGKKVGFGTIGSGTEMTATNIFRLLGVSISKVNMPADKMLESLKRGDIEAFVHIAQKPLLLLESLSEADHIHLLPLDYSKLFKVYSQANISNSDYPNLVPPRQVVKSVAVQTVLAVFNFTENNSRIVNVRRFIKSLHEGLDELKNNHNPLWNHVDICSDVHGWKRHVSVLDLCTSSKGTSSKALISEYSDLPDSFRKNLISIFVKKGISQASSEVLVASMIDDEVISQLKEITGFPEKPIEQLINEKIVDEFIESVN